MLFNVTVFPFMTDLLAFPCKLYTIHAVVCIPTANPCVGVYCMLLCAKCFSFIRNYLSYVVYLFVIFFIVGFNLIFFFV